MKYLLLLALMLTSCLGIIVGCQSPPAPTTMTARVERVLSGQAIEVTLVNQQPTVRQQVRLQGIDAPTTQQAPWGKNALEKLTALIAENNPQQLVQLELQELQPDQFGRLTAPVWQKQTLLNLALVQGGYALAQLPQDTDEAMLSILNKHQTELLRAQDQARVLGIGIWDPTQPLRLPPSEFRRLRSTPEKIPETSPKVIPPKNNSPKK